MASSVAESSHEEGESAALEPLQLAGCLPSGARLRGIGWWMERRLIRVAAGAGLPAAASTAVGPPPARRRAIRGEQA